MGLEYGWRHARKRWSWKLRILKKSQLRLAHGGRELSSFRWGIELDLVRWRCSWVFLISTDRDLKHHKMRRALGMVSIVRVVSLSPCVAMDRSQKLINRSYLKQQSPLVSCICVCIVLVLWLISLLLWLYNTHNVFCLDRWLCSGFFFKKTPSVLLKWAACYIRLRF